MSSYTDDLEDFYIKQDSDPNHQKYAERFIRLLGHRAGPWILERSHPNYDSYSGMNHLTYCVHCGSYFIIKAYHDSADVNFIDGLLIYWRKHEYARENETELLARIHKTAVMMRLHRKQVICQRISSLL